MAMQQPTTRLDAAPQVGTPPIGADEALVLSEPAVAFVAGLVRRFAPRVEALLAQRKERQAARDAGEPLDFLASTADVRAGDWRIGPLPNDLLDRRVEITGPVDRKMIVNALSSGASAFMADFEDATSPTWANLIQGQANLYAAVRRAIDFDDPTTGKRYALPERTATLLVRPRGWHMVERNLSFEGFARTPASLVDFGLFLFHNAQALITRGSGPYFYLPKLESHLEARLWNDVFLAAQETLGLPRGTIKATVLIETLPAAFEMDEILFELREHIAGLNCGRWDYIFSTIKTLRAHADRVLPDRSAVTMTQPMMRAYTQLLIKTCHRRGAFAMGGMSALIPVKGDAQANERALAGVRADKLREVEDGHDGTWVAHPALVPIAREVFDAGLKGEVNQLRRLRSEFTTTAAELVETPRGPRTLEGLRHNIRVGVQYIEAWLSGRGCVPLYGLMEDAATAEISRSQIWQWLRHGAELDGERITTPRFRTVLAEEMHQLSQTAAPGTQLERARDLFDRLCTSPELADFLTLEAYELL